MDTETTYRCPDCCEEIEFLTAIQTGDVRGNYVWGKCSCHDDWRRYEAGGAWDDVRRPDGDGGSVEADLDDEADAPDPADDSPTLDMIRGHLERIGVDSGTVGSAQAIVANFDTDRATRRLTLADDWASWEGYAGEALDRLVKIPDGAGLEAFWGAFDD